MTRKFFASAVVVLLLCFCGCAYSAQTVGGVKNADIVFFIDSSGSMGDDIDGVRTNLSAFARSLVSSDVSARFAVVEYQYSRGIIVHRLNNTDIWTSSSSQVEAVLRTISADDGDGDTVQAVNEIFSWTGSQDFRADASRFGFIVTDVIDINHVASNGETAVDFNNYEELSMDKAIQTLNSLMAGTVQGLKSIDMYMSVISTPGLRSHYQNIYSQTGGVFIDITSSNYYRSMLDIAQWISEEVSTANPLPHALVQAVPDEIISYVSGDETVLQRIAKLAHIEVEQINVITYESLDLRLPHEPTEAMKRKAGGEFVAKLDTLVLSFDSIPEGEAGYFLFQLEIPDEVLSKNLRVSDLRLWYATPDEFSASSAQVFSPAVFDPFTYYEITDLFGYKADTLAKKMLVLVFCNTGKSLSMWLLKILLLAAGCNSPAVTFGIGGAAGLSVLGFVLLRRVFTKR